MRLNKSPDDSTAAYRMTVSTSSGRRLMLPILNDEVPYMFYIHWDIWKEFISNWDWDKIELEEEVMAILISDRKKSLVVNVTDESDDSGFGDGHARPNKRILVSKALEFDADQVILARNDLDHNHYGEGPEALEAEDLERLLAELDIELIDYMVVSKKGYGSLMTGPTGSE